MKKQLLSSILFFLSLAIAAQTPSGFSQKRQSKNVDDAKIKGFETIDGSKSGSVRRFTQPINKADFINQKIVRDSTEGYVLFIENNAPAASGKQLRVSAEKLADDFIEKNKELLQLKNTQEELTLVSTTTDESGTSHVRMQQHYKNIPVYGGEVVVHVKDSRVESLNGRAFATPNISTNPSIGKAQAIELALNDVAKAAKIEVRELTENNLFDFQKNTAELFVYYHNGTPKLTYELTIRPNSVERWIYKIDAQTGEIISKFNHTCTLDGVFKTTARDLNGKTQEFRIYEQNGTYFLIDATQKMFSPERSKMPNTPVGAIWTIDAQNSKIGGNMQFAHVTSSNGTNWSATAVSAHTNANTCYNYYVNTHGRNSLNGSGGNIVSVINISDEDGKGLDNAYWNGEFMGYGNGKDGFKPLAGALDVAGHEMTHGVIENTARLEYRNQSGALNESFADIFGVLIDRDDWTLGEDVVIKSVFPSGALRSLADPNQGGTSLKSRGFQPKTMAQYVFLRDTPDEDNGGVHVNSGIPNHAFYLFATNTNVGLARAEKVYYQVITNYLTRTSKFIDLRLGVIQAAKTLYGETVAAAARQAFDAVGIVETTSTPTQPQTTPDIPTNPGTESLVVYDPLEETLYYGAFNQSQFTAFGKGLGCLNKPSITDDGSFVYFVGKNKNIYRKDLRTTAAPVVISENGLFRNVAISKDGKRLAALAATADKFIYVFDLVNNTNVKFSLYNSTYTQGVSTDEVLYADSFEWDYSGEFIIYDAFNRVSSLFGNVEYWDVGILQAWNPSTNKFASGNIEKIFTNLERGDNIGNPAIAKTNPSVLAFDYYNDNNEKNYIVSINLDNGTVKSVLENNDIAYPDYAKADDKLVFNSLNGSKNIVRGIPMKSDKVSPAGNPITYFTDAKWAVWYAQGQRQLPTKSAQTITFSQIPNQQPRATVTLNATASSTLAVQYSIKSGDATLSGNRVTLGTTPGKVLVEAFQVGNSSFAAASAEQSFCIVPPAPSISLSGRTLTATGGQTYQWYVNGNLIGGQTTLPTFNAAFGGTYAVQAITADGCGSNLSGSIVVQSLVLGTENPAVSVSVYPNPVGELLQIDVPKDVLFKEMECYDATGRQIFKQPFEPKINTQKLTSGTYILKLIGSKSEVHKRFVKE